MGSKKKKSRPTATPSNAPPPPEFDDDRLLDDLMAQIRTKDTAAQQQVASVVNNEASSSKTDSRTRFAARKLRRAEKQAAFYSTVNMEADARIEQEAREEERAIKCVCDDLGLTMYEINPDGHCLYAAVADQLRILGLLPPADAHYATTRAAAAAYMTTHADAFLPFLPSVESEDGAGAGVPGLMGPREFERYCENVRVSAVWGGEPEILALSRAYDVPIHVVQACVPSVVVPDPAEGQSSAVDDKRIVRISYHRRMYGLGEHYNSLRPRSLTQQLKAIIS